MKKRKHHKEVTLMLPHICISVDAKIAELVQLMNFHGLETTNSCQGDTDVHDELGYGYVQFTGSAAPRFLHKLLTALLSATTMTDIQIGRWADNDTWPNSYDIRWRPNDYQKILPLVREAREACIRNFN